MAVKESLDQSTVLFKAFADPVRLRLLHLLRDGERCVCDLVAVLGGPQPKISRHLAYLRRAGLVRTRRDGLWIYYRLAEPTTALHRRLIECVGSCLGDVEQLQADRRKLAELTGQGSDGCDDEACCG